MLFAVALFAAMDTSMKMLSGTYPASQIAALRFLGSLPLILAVVLLRGKAPTLLRARWGLQLVRALLGMISLVLFAYGLKSLGLTETYSIFFVAPFLIVGLSMLFLGERVTATKWLAILLAFMGVLTILRPDPSRIVGTAGLAVLGSALCYAVVALLVPVLAKTDSSESMMFWMIAVGALATTLLSFGSWVPIQQSHAFALALLVVPGFLAQFALTEAFRRGQPSVVAPLEYTALLWGTGIDLVLWEALPASSVLLGGVLIAIAGIKLIRTSGP